MQRIAVHCSALHCIAVNCSALHCIAVPLRAVKCNEMQLSAVQSSAVKCRRGQITAFQAIHSYIVKVIGCNLTKLELASCTLNLSWTEGWYWSNLFPYKFHPLPKHTPLSLACTFYCIYIVYHLDWFTLFREIKWLRCGQDLFISLKNPYQKVTGLLSKSQEYYHNTRFYKLPQHCYELFHWLYRMFFWVFISFYEFLRFHKWSSLLVDKRLTTPPLSTLANLIVFKLRNSFICFCWPTLPPPFPYHL